MPDDTSTTTTSDDGLTEQQKADEERKEEQKEEDKEDEEEFHPHRGKVMEIRALTQISSLSWDKSYDNPTGTSTVNIHYSKSDLDEILPYLYKGVSCKVKIRRSNEPQFTNTGVEEYGLSDDEIKQREHYPTKEQLEEIATERAVDDLNDTSDRSAEEKEQDEAEETNPYTRSDGDAGIYGFVTDVTHDEKGTELEIKDWGYCLEDNTKKLSFNNMLRSQILEEVIKSYGLVPVIDFTGLKDDMITWSNVSSGGGGNDNSDDGTGNVTGDGSMTEEEAWEIARSWGYNGSCSSHEPEEAWDTLGTKKGVSPDCYGATAWLYYVFNTKVGIPARDICYHSDYASSGSHHTIQLYRNGKWEDPPEYDQMHNYLGVIKSRNKSEDHICRPPPSGGSIPPYSKCPHSNNG